MRKKQQHITEGDVCGFGFFFFARIDFLPISINIFSLATFYYRLKKLLQRG